MNKIIFLSVFFFVTITIFACGKIDVSGLDEADFNGAQTGDIEFANQILPTFTSAGCNISGCHSGSSPQGGLLLTGTAAQVCWSLRENNVINLTEEADSTLLLAPLATDTTITHDSQKPFATTSDTTYQLWLTWIRQGAINN